VALVDGIAAVEELAPQQAGLFAAAVVGEALLRASLVPAAFVVGPDDVAEALAAAVLAVFVVLTVAARPEALLSPFHTLAEDRRVDKSESLGDARVVLVVDDRDGQRRVRREGPDLAKVAGLPLAGQGRWLLAVSFAT